MYQRQAGFGEAVRRAFSNYCNFSGRASRSEYWWFALFNYIVAMMLLTGHYFSTNTMLGSTNDFALDTFSVLYYIWCLVVILPGLGLIWRRLHDIGKGGGWYFIGLIPLVGGIILIVWFCKESEPIDNRFGPVPNLAN